MNKDKPEKNQNTISLWVQNYSDALFNRAFYKTSDRETAEDLVQDTFMAAMKAYETFKGESNPKTWLFSILNNKIVDHYRRQARSFLKFETSNEEKVFRETEDMFDSNDKWAEIPSHTTWDEDHRLLDDPDFRKIMDLCMDDLPLNWKTILLSKYIMGKEGKEICKELSITPTNYWQILHRSKLMVKKCIEKYWVE